MLWVTVFNINRAAISKKSECPTNKISAQFFIQFLQCLKYIHNIFKEIKRFNIYFFLLSYTIFKSDYSGLDSILSTSKGTL